MRIKLDENVHGDARDALAGWGHDVTTAREEDLAGHPDIDIAAAVKAEGRCLVTFDLDFADPRRFPPAEFAGLVVLRLRVPTSKLQVRRIVSFFAEQSEVAGRLWIVAETRARDCHPQMLFASRSSRELHWWLPTGETPVFPASADRGTENVLGRDRKIPRRVSTRR